MIEDILRKFQNVITHPSGRISKSLSQYLSNEYQLHIDPSEGSCLE
jgi:hypothetical protein